LCVDSKRNIVGWRVIGVGC